MNHCTFWCKVTVSKYMGVSTLSLLISTAMQRQNVGFKSMKWLFGHTIHDIWIEVKFTDGIVNNIFWSCGLRWHNQVWRRETVTCVMKNCTGLFWTEWGTQDRQAYYFWVIPCHFHSFNEVCKVELW